MKTVLARRYAALLAVAGCLAFGSSAPATLLGYEPFLVGSTPAAGEYSIGLLDPTDAVGDGQNPASTLFTGAWERSPGGDAPNGAIQAPSLSFLSSTSLGGSMISNPDSRQRRNLTSPFTAATVGTYYMGFQVNYGAGNYVDGIQGADMGYRSTELLGADGTFIMGIAYNSYGTRTGNPAQQQPQTGRMYADFSGAGLNSGDFIIANSPDNFMADGATHLLVLKFELSDQAASDKITVYLDPVSALEPSVDEAGPTISNVDFTLGAIRGVTLFGGFNGVSPVYDELRIATTFIEAVPELPIPGDTNNDKKVDILDYNAILAHYGQTGQSTANGDVARADGKQGIDGKVDVRDFRLWKDNRTDLGTPPGAGGLNSDAQVPEPLSIALLVSAMAMLLPWAGRRRAVR